MAARLSGKAVAMVIGCGQIGLAVIAALKACGFCPVMAVDYSERRRMVAEQIGADVIIDPAKESPHARWSEFNVPRILQDLAIAKFMGDPADASAEQKIEHVNRLADAGVTWTTLPVDNKIFSKSLQDIQAFASDVMPHVRCCSRPRQICGVIEQRLSGRSPQWKRQR